MEKEEVKVTLKSETKASSAKTKKSSLEVAVWDLKGKETGTETLSETIFGHKENDALIAHYMRVYLYNQRQGTVSTKTRSEVTGSTKKIYRQKGTGGARHGSRKANVFKGGGVTFGPKPRTFAMTINKKQKKQALFISLSMKVKDNAIAILDKESLSMKPKTKHISDFLQAAKIEDKKILFVLPEVTPNGFVLSARNIPNVQIISAQTINPYEVLNTQKLIFVGDAINKLEEHFNSPNENQ